MKRFFLFCICFFLIGGMLPLGGISAVPDTGGSAVSPLPVSYGKPYTVTLHSCTPLKAYPDDGTLLTDHAFGSILRITNAKGSWVGYASDGANFQIEITLDLLSVYDNLRHFSISCQQDSAKGFYFPSAIRYAISTDGNRFTPIGDATPDCDPENDPYCGIFRLRTREAWSARYIRATIEGKANQNVLFCEFIAEGLASVQRIADYAEENGQYTDNQGVIYTLHDGCAEVTGFRSEVGEKADGMLFPTQASFDSAGEYMLGAGSGHETTVHAEFVGYDNQNFSDLANDIRYIVIHNTATVEPSTTAALYHKKLLRGGNDASWHYTVDDTDTIYHTVPDEYVAWHAGGDRNYCTIGIEMCVNYAPTRSGQFVFSGDAYDRWIEQHFRKTIENTALLVAELLVRYDLPETAVIQHNDCNGKNCPQWMRYQKSTGRFVHDGDLWLLLLERIHRYYVPLAAGKAATAPPQAVSIPEYLLFADAVVYPVTSVRGAIFRDNPYCPETLALPRTVTSIDPTAFSGAKALQNISVDPNNPIFSVRNGQLFDKNGVCIFPQIAEVYPLPTPAIESGLSVERAPNGEIWLFGLTEPCDVSELAKRFGASKGICADYRMGTGSVVTLDGVPMRVLIPGDGSGDGLVNITDYLISKRTVLETFTPADIFRRAISFTSASQLNPQDYLLLKRYILGSVQLPQLAR